MVVTKSCFFPVVKKAYANNQQADRFVFSETFPALIIIKINFIHVSGISEKLKNITKRTSRGDTK